MAKLKSPPGGLVIGGKRYPSGTILPDQYRRQFEVSERPRDPGTRSDTNVPNMGRAIVPHVLTFSGLMTGLARTYRYSDEALRHSIDNAHMMLNDPMIAGPLLARQHMTALLNWSIESEDEKDPKLKAIAAELTDIIGRTARFTEYRRCLLEAIWYGRYGIQNLYGFHTNRHGIRRRIVRDWVPISGDKLLYRFDDGSGDYDRDQIGIKVSASMASRDFVAGRRAIEPTGEGLAYFLEKWERKLLTVHKHYVRDGEFEDPRSGGQVHGVGLRHFLYWIWYQKQEAFAQVAEIVERTGMGFIIYFYPHGNAQARAEVEKISREQAHTNTILMPAEPEDTYRVEQIPPNTSGLQVLMDYIEAYLGDLIVRFILGQTLSSKPSATGMNTGVADLQKDSLFHIIRYDAVNLEETMTRELVLPNRDFNFPKYRNVDFWLRISTKVAAPEQELQALQQLWQMGAEIKTADIFDRLDLSVPDSDDKTLFNPQVVQAAKQFKDSLKQPPPQLGGGAPGGPPGMPPGAPPPGGGMPPGGAPPAGGEMGGPPEQLDKEDEERTEKERLFGPILYRKVERDRALTDIAAAVANTDRDLSDAQRDSGIYRKGRFWWHGMEIVLEVPKGCRRRPDWEPMGAHYGYIRRHYSPEEQATVTTDPSKDGDHIDIFFGSDPESEIVFVIDQTRKNGKTFDEHKVCLGFLTEAEARKAYLDSYQAGWKLGTVTPLTIGQFSAFLEHGDTRKPVAKQVAEHYARRSVKSSPGQIDLFGAFNTPTAPARPQTELHVGDTKYEGGHVYTLNQNHRWEGPVEEGPLPVEQPKAVEESVEVPPEVAEPLPPVVESESEKEPDHAREQEDPEAGPEQPDAGRGDILGRADDGESGGSGDLGANRVKPPEERIVISREQFTAPADRSRVPARLQQHLNDHQQEGVAKAIDSLDANGGFLNADGTGTGKTRQQLAIGQYYLDQGKKVLVVAPMEVLKANWKKNSVFGSWKNDSDAMGVSIRLTKDNIAPNAVNLTTYENLAKMKGLVDENTVLIFDEGHKLKNRLSARSKHAKGMIAKCHAVMFATATPIDKVEHLDYLDRAGVFGGQYYAKTYEQLGLEQVDQWTGQATVKVWKPKVKHSEVMRRVAGLFDRLTKDGKMIKREISMEGVPVEVHRLEMPEECHYAMNKIEEDISSRGYAPGLERSQILMQQRRQQEPYKVATAVQMAMDAMKKGRQVVIFASRVNESVVGDEDDEDAIRSDGTMVLLKQALLEAGVPESEIAEIHGGVKKSDIPLNMDRFQSGEAKVVIATIESGGTGINLDDIKGDRPRTLVMVTAPFSAVENMQAAGRIWRLNTLSTPEFHYLFGDTEVDEWNSGLIGKKMKTLGASISGQVGRLDITQIDEKDFIDFEPEEPFEWNWPGEGEAPQATFSRLDNGEWGLRIEGNVKVGDEVEITRKDGTKERKKIASIVKSVKGAKIATFESAGRGAPKPKEELPKPPEPPAKPTKVYSDEKKKAIHAALQNLQAMDRDRASVINGMGFNKFDGQMGHALANRGWLTDEEAEIGERLIAKYKRQIDPSTMEVAMRQEEQPKREPVPEPSKPKSDNPLHNLARWSEPKNVTTSRGSRIVRTAYPDNKFWDLWRKDKESLKKQGISVTKYQGDWQLTWWEEPPGAEKHARLRAAVLRYVKEHHPDFYARRQLTSSAGQGSLFGGAPDPEFERLHPRGQPTNPGQFAPKEGGTPGTSEPAEQPFSLTPQVQKPKAPKLDIEGIGGKQGVMWRGLKTDMPGQRDFIEEAESKAAEAKRAALPVEPSAPVQPVKRGKISDYLDASKYPTKQAYVDAEVERLKTILPDDDEDVLRSQAEMWAADRWKAPPKKGQFDVDQTVSVGGKNYSYRGSFEKDGKTWAVVAGGGMGQMSVPFEQVELAAPEQPEAPANVPEPAKPPTGLQKNQNPAQVGQVLTNGKTKIRDKSAVRLRVPGMEEYQLAWILPHGQARLGTKNDGELVEESTGVSIDRARHPGESMESVVSRVQQRFGSPSGKEKLDAGLVAAQKQAAPANVPDIDDDAIHNWDAPYIQQQWASKLTDSQKADMQKAMREHHQKGRDARELAKELKAKWSSEPQQNAKSADLIPGGLAADADPQDFDPHALAQGVIVEMEHTSDPRYALEIAMDHLSESPDYYDRLAKMESEPEQYAQGQWSPEKHPRGQPDNAGEFASSSGGSSKPARKLTLWRAAEDDTVTDTASFAETPEAAQAYLNNPGFGGRNLYRTAVEINPDEVLDLTEESDPVQALADAVDMRHPGAIGADEWAPRIGDKIAAAGYSWVRVNESYPSDTVTWIWVGGDDPEMEQVDDSEQYAKDVPQPGDPEFERLHPRGQPENAGQFTSAGQGQAPVAQPTAPAVKPAPTPADLAALARQQDTGRSGAAPPPHKFANLGERLESAPEGASIMGWEKSEGNWNKEGQILDTAGFLQQFSHPLHKHQIHGELDQLEAFLAEPEAEAPEISVEDEDEAPEPEMGSEDEDEGDASFFDFDPSEMGDAEPEPEAEPDEEPTPEAAAPEEAPGPAPEPGPVQPAEPPAAPLPEHLSDKTLGPALDAAPEGTQIGEWTKMRDPMVGPYWSKGNAALQTKQFLEKFQDQDDREAIADALAPQTSPQAPGATPPGAGQPAGPRMSEDDREAVQNVAEAFGIQSGDIENDRRLRLFLNRTARHLGFNPESAGKDTTSQAIASAQYLNGQKQHLNAVEEMAKGYGWKGGAAMELAARARTGGRYLVQAAQKRGFQSSQGKDEKADLAGAMRFLRDHEADQPQGAPTPMMDILNKLFSKPEKITFAHVAGAVLGFWLVYSMMRRGRGRR